MTKSVLILLSSERKSAQELIIFQPNTSSREIPTKVFACDQRSTAKVRISLDIDIGKPLGHLKSRLLVSRWRLPRHLQCPWNHIGAVRILRILVERIDVRCKVGYGRPGETSSSA